MSQRIQNSINIAPKGSELHNAAIPFQWLERSEVMNHGIFVALKTIYFEFLSSGYIFDIDVSICRHDVHKMATSVNKMATSVNKTLLTSSVSFLYLQRLCIN
jgi:hypothetical protein